MIRKRCSTCHKQKSESLFGVNKSGKIYAKCKKCRGVVKEEFKYTPSEVIQMLCFHLNVELSQLVSENTTKSISLKRHILMYFLFRSTPLTLKEVASVFNRSDHTSVLYANKKIKGFVKMYPIFRNVIRNIRKSLNRKNTNYFYKISNIEPESSFSF